MSDSTISRRVMLKRTAMFGVAAAAGPVLVGACGSSGGNGSGGSSSAETLSSLKKQGYVRVGFANEAPYGYANANGDLTGEAPTVAGTIMKKLGIPSTQGVLTEFGSLIPGLVARRFDMIAAGMFITPARCQQILFSDPDYIGTEGLAVPSGNPHHLVDYSSIAADPSLKIGVETGAVEGTYAGYEGVKSSQIQQFPDGPTGMEALVSGRVDAFSLTAISLQYLLSTGSYKGLEVVSFVPKQNGKPIETGGGYGFPLGATALVSTFNTQLRAMQKSGELASLVKPFGFVGSTVTDAYGLTSAELCK